tara:strand:+ start:1088 stop:1393 length:306 start_codon:yes stop_codon:yes gene_type:complete
MADLPDPAILTVNGSYDIPVAVAREHLFALKGVFGGATVTMTTRSDTDQSGATFDSVTDGAWTDETEQLFAAPSQIARLTVTNAGGSTAIRVLMTSRKVNR